MRSKFYNFSDVKDGGVCPKCGGELQDYAEIEKWNQAEKNKKFERYYKFEKRVAKEGTKSARRGIKF
jgi:putative adenylate kinase